MKARTSGFFLSTLIIFTCYFANAEEKHKIPVAPPEYLAMKNIFNISEKFKDKKFIKRSGRAYKRKCLKCHGVNGDGKGSRAVDFVIKPVAFAAPGYLNSRSDGQLYWIIENGSPGTEMPAHGFGSRANLNNEEIWQIITFLRYKYTN
ncbi:MAG: cytochrome c [Magnetococcales bacterium]|nr:cytochrome c [Magnetococcales bacterium]